MQVDTGLISSGDESLEDMFPSMVKSVTEEVKPNKSVADSTLKKRANSLQPM